MNRYCLVQTNLPCAYRYDPTFNISLHHRNTGFHYRPSCRDHDRAVTGYSDEGRATVTGGYLMGFNPKDYPPDWKISRHIRFDVAKGQCQCAGECGLHKDHPGPRRCEEMDRQPAKWARGIVVLTVAHLDYKGGPCRCKAETGKKCGIPEHLKAMCNRCHLRIDMPHHRKHALDTRRARMAIGDLFE